MQTELATHEMIMFIAFGIIVVIMLALDLGIFNKKSHKISTKEALHWSMVWISIALLFGLVMHFYLDEQKSSEFFTAYLVEKALSVDNLFVFILIFSYFQVPAEYQHKVLYWGVLGAIVMRAVFIFSGVWLIQLTYLPEFVLFGHVFKLNILLTLFGFFLIYAGIKAAQHDEEEPKDFSKNIAVRIIKKLFPVTTEYNGDHFFTIQNGKRFATPLLLVVGVIEVTDLIFAVDSIPAIFTISNDPIVLYASNIFAIMGLRALYFLLASMMYLFSYLKYGLAVILSFIGVKMLLAEFIHFKISSPISLSVVAGILTISVVLSLIFKPQNKE